MATQGAQNVTGSLGCDGAVIREQKGIGQRKQRPRSLKPDVIILYSNNSL